MLYNPYDLIIIKENVIPQENIEELMLLTNNKDTSHATIINNEKEDGSDTDLEVRNTLWYHITEEAAKNLQQAVAGCFVNYVAPKYNCQFKLYEPVQFLGYPVGGHYNHIMTVNILIMKLVNGKERWKEMFHFFFI